MANKIEQVSGDLLDFAESHYICHQCNCKTTHCKGLSAAVFSRFPTANTYTVHPNTRKPGNIDIIGHIVNMYGQVYPSSPKYPRDLYGDRCTYFRQCLSKLHTILPADAKVAFPYGIGCGLAGGKWADYEAMISDFYTNCPTRDVIIVQK
jgi:O-acetyl-ADP-ribose deacetylase (regulator of RNase III)